MCDDVCVYDGGSGYDSDGGRAYYDGYGCGFFSLFHTFTKVHSILSNAVIRHLTKKNSNKFSKTSSIVCIQVLALSKTCLLSDYTLKLGFLSEAV